MDESGSELDALRARMAGLADHLNGDWAEKLSEHLHLDRDTTECAYWHSGYHQALNDLLQVFMRDGATTCGSAGTSSLSRVAC